MANSERPETQINSKNQPANIQPISRNLSLWRSANYRGLEVGKSKDKDMRRILGTPASTIQTPGQPQLRGYYYGGADSLIVRVEKTTRIIAWIVTNSKNLSKDDLIRNFGDGYILLTYGSDPCFMNGKPRPAFVASFENAVTSTNAQYVQMEYRDLGLNIKFRSENEVSEITYVSDKWPLGTTSSMCDQPKKGLAFVACGCGCCGGTIPSKKCIYRSKGDDIKELVDENRKWTGPICATVGCSPGIKYVFCD